MKLASLILIALFVLSYPSLFTVVVGGVLMFFILMIPKDDGSYKGWDG